MGFLFYELWLRRTRGVEPSKLASLKKYLDKKKAPSSSWVPFIFSWVAFFLFAVWEATLTHMYGRRFYFVSWVIALLLWSLLLVKRRRIVLFDADPRLRQSDVLLMSLSWLILFESLMGVLLFLWVIFRSKFLTLQKNDLN